MALATTRLISMHQNQGKTVMECLSDRTGYAKNSFKTEGGELIATYECCAETVDIDFMLTKKEYEFNTGRTQGNNVIAYQIRQSFKPNEVAPGDANKIGYDLALKFTKGEHAFIVCTHTDKAHIHNHIIFNSTNLDATKKFHDFFLSQRAVRKISDHLCLENGLSIVENPQPSKGHYGDWLGEGKPKSQRQALCQTIDFVLSKHPPTFEDFLKQMTTAGYEAKQGKHLAFRMKEQLRFMRLRSLPKEYSEEHIRAAIEPTEAPKRSSKSVLDAISKTPNTPTQRQSQPVNLLIDVQSKVQQGKGKGYERWAKNFNIKQMSQTLSFLSENNLLAYGDLDAETTACTTDFHEVRQEIKAIESRMTDIATLQKHIVQYIQTKDVYADYHKSGYAPKFRNQHQEAIALHKEAKAYFDSLGLKKLPTMQSLKAEFHSLKQQKNTAYSRYHKSKEKMQEILTAKANVDKILEKDDKKTQKKKPLKKR